MTQLFKLLLKLTVENCDEATMMRVSGGQYEPVDPRSWNRSMDVAVNVGLGTGQEDQKQAALQQALQIQMQVFQAYGPQNGIVGMTQIRNTLGDMLAMNGLSNTERYFLPMSIEQEQMILQQQQQQAAQQQQALTQPEAYVQAEQIKAQAKATSDMAKLQIDAQKAIAADDRDRDQMDQDLLVDAAEILGKYGTAVDTARIKAEQAAPRYPDSTPVQAVTGGRF
jgi:ATPase subunit of ABC transporter with duplicated ATPase domains